MMDFKKDLDKMRVLVVDDEPDNLSLVSVVLQYNGAVVAEAASGQACLDLLDSFKPTLILLDISMPRMDGWEVFKHIRALPALNDVPVVALTANVLPTDAAKVREAGFNGYITKPFRVTALVEELRKCITTFKTQTQEAAAVKAATSVSDTAPVPLPAAPVSAPAPVVVPPLAIDPAAPAVTTPAVASPAPAPAPASDGAQPGKAVLSQQEGQQAATPVAPVQRLQPVSDTPTKP